jgi:hypothetical protein
LEGSWNPTCPSAYDIERKIFLLLTVPKSLCLGLGPLAPREEKICLQWQIETKLCQAAWANNLYICIHAEWWLVEKVANVRNIIDWKVLEQYLKFPISTFFRYCFFGLLFCVKPIKISDKSIELGDL